MLLSSPLIEQLAALYFILLFYEFIAILAITCKLGAGRCHLKANR